MTTPNLKTSLLELLTITAPQGFFRLNNDTLTEDYILERYPFDPDTHPYFNH